MDSYDTNALLDRLGGTAAVAKIFGIKPPSVSGWRRAGRIPRARLMFLEVKHPDLFLRKAPLPEKEVA